MPGGQEGSPGHASIWGGSIYVSFWPGKDVGTLKWKGFKTRTFGEDCAYYKKNKQKFWSKSLPNDTNGPGLNERKMQQRWKAIQSSGVNYTWDFQCSTVVNELLIAGGCPDIRQFRLDVVVHRCRVTERCARLYPDARRRDQKGRWEIVAGHRFAPPIFS
ncbi:MAG: hypothetical protein ABGX22_25000 [Pirellulaceae bacterium]